MSNPQSPYHKQISQSPENTTHLNKRYISSLQQVALLSSGFPHKIPTSINDKGCLGGFVGLAYSSRQEHTVRVRQILEGLRAQRETADARVVWVSQELGTRKQDFLGRVIFHDQNPGQSGDSCFES